jgi:hypothetical protein
MGGYTVNAVYHPAIWYLVLNAVPTLMLASIPVPNGAGRGLVATRRTCARRLYDFPSMN